MYTAGLYTGQFILCFCSWWVLSWPGSGSCASKHLRSHHDPRPRPKPRPKKLRTQVDETIFQHSKRRSLTNFNKRKFSNCQMQRPGTMRTSALASCRREYVAYHIQSSFLWSLDVYITLCQHTSSCKIWSTCNLMLHLHASISFLHPLSLCCTALHNTWYLMSVLRGLDPLVPLHSRVIQAIVPANTPKDFLTKCIEIIVSVYSFQTDSNWSRFLMYSQSQPNTCTIYQLQVSIEFMLLASCLFEVTRRLVSSWQPTWHWSGYRSTNDPWCLKRAGWGHEWILLCLYFGSFIFLPCEISKTTRLYKYIKIVYTSYVLSQSTSSLPSIQSHHPVLLHRSTLHARPFHNLPNPPGHPAEICDGKIRPSLVRRRREIHFYHPPGMARNFGDGCIFNGPCVPKNPEDDESCHDMSVMIFVVYILCLITLYIWEKGAHHVILKKRYQNIQPFVVANCSSHSIVLHPRY